MKIPTPSRRGGAYVLVLIVSGTAATIALGGLAMRHVAAERGETIDDLATARLLAQSGLETTLQWGEETPDWRINNGFSITRVHTLARGELTIEVTDPADNKLNDDTTDPYRIECTAVVNDSRAVLAVDVVGKQLTEYRDRVLAANPVGFWPLDETPKFSLDDLAGDLDGGYSSSAVSGQDTGPDGRPAPLFLTDKDVGFIPHSSRMSLAQGTFMFNFRCDTNAGVAQVIFAKDRHGPGDETGAIDAWLEDWNGNLWLVAYLEDGRNNTDHWHRVEVGTWYHVAMSFGPDGFRLYVDGVHEAWNMQRTVGIDSNTNMISIGSWIHDDHMHDPLIGSVRDFVLFDSQLDTTAINELLNDPPPEEFTVDPDSWAWVVD